MGRSAVQNEVTHMAVQEFILDEPVQPWERVTTPDSPDYTEGSFVSHKFLADGLGGRPQAHVFALGEEGFQVAAHFHDVDQFQVMLEGTMSLSNHTLEPIGVHYTDADTPYGPFSGGPKDMMAVLRPSRAGKVWMNDPEGRKGRNPLGRELIAVSRDLEWQELSGALAGVQCKLLLGTEDEEGPKAQLWKCASGFVLERGPTPFGEYQVLVKGSARLGNHEMKPYCMRYVVGDEAPAQITAGPEGATWLILTFEQRPH